MPASLTTKGTLILISFAASTTPCASTSHLIIPPKIFISIPFTFLSDKIILNAAETFSLEAPPPTSKKFAGSSPYNLIISMVAIANPAPFTIHPIFPSNLMYARSCLLASISVSSSSLKSLSF